MNSAHPPFILPLRRLGLIQLGIACGLATACSSPPPAPFVLLSPAVVIQQSLEPGSSLGPVPAASRHAGSDAAEEGQPEDSSDAVVAPIPVRCRFVYLRRPHQATLLALGSDAAVVADLEGAHPVLPTPALTLSTLYAQGPEAVAWLKALRQAPPGEALEITSRSGFVPVGASFRLSIQSNELVEDPRDWLDEFRNRGPIPREVAVIVSGTSTGPRVALSVTDLDPDREAQMRQSYRDDPSIAATQPPPAQDEVLRREVLNIGRYPELSSPLVLHLDSPFSAGNGTSIAVIVEVLGEDEIEGTNEVEAVARLAASSARLGEQRVPLTEERRHAIERTEALSVFQLKGGRSALLQVAQESGAMLAQDLALVADSEFLDALGQSAFPAGEVEKARPAASTSDGVDGADGADAQAEASIGWRLEAAAWKLLASRALDETLDPELMGVFFRRAGALAAFPDIVQDAVKAARGSQTRFDERLVTEQRYFLEDPSPSARLRAFDWLTERGVEIPGYDPLADRKERQAALEAAASDVAPLVDTAAATTQGGQQ